MGFKVIPKSIGGISVNSALGPLAELFRNDKIDNIVFPSDLGSNPAMGHAVVFQAYDITTALAESGKKVVGTLNESVRTGIESVGKGVENALKGNISSGTGSIIAGAASAGLGFFGSKDTLKSAGELAGDLILAPSYRQQRKGEALTTISLFMPESIQVSYNSEYSDPSMTEMFGLAGIVGNAISDISKVGFANAVTPYATATLSKIAGNILSSAAGFNNNPASVISQAFGVVSNPQTQLLYKGTALREFQLEFILTPKSAAEAEKVKQICDSFAFYSLPNIAGGQVGTSGQYLNPPQLFSIQFKFLGANDLIGNISNVVSSALTNSGLGFLTTGNKISNGKNEAKLFTVKDCILENVSVDYTPNGFATYNDGYPVQTRLTLSFKETQMITKEHFRGSNIAANYASRGTNSFTNQSEEHAANARSVGNFSV